MGDARKRLPYCFFHSMSKNVISLFPFSLSHFPIFTLPQQSLPHTYCPILPSPNSSEKQCSIVLIKRSKRKLVGLKTFSNGLMQHIKAVENAIRLPSSNGAVEGHVNRIKSIKRQMYGRDGFELLRRKVILSQSG